MTPPLKRSNNDMSCSSTGRMSSVLTNLRNTYVKRKRSSPKLSQESKLPQKSEDLWWSNGVSSIRQEILLIKQNGREQDHSFLCRQRKRPRIQFAQNVHVKEIPHRNFYSTEMKEAMWNNRSKIQQNARRNSIEAAWECCDWEDAAEEDEFLSISGELVHPAHLRDENKATLRESNMKAVLAA